MNTRNLISCVIFLSLISCTSSIYIQIYKATPTTKVTTHENLLIYQDEYCKVSYNFWAEAGNIGFNFYNKTDQNIYLNMTESFFILNGVAYDYYRNRTFTSSKTSGATATVSESATKYNYLNLIQNYESVGLINSSGFSVSYNEEKIICIPSKTTKNVTKYNINKIIYRDCDLFKYPNKKQIKTKKFSKTDSPIVFSNRLSYSIGNAEKLITFENEFYISEISNYPKNQITEIKYDTFCNQTDNILIEYFKDISPDKFYLQYTKKYELLEH